MAICDSQSFPLYTHRCTPDSDSNIFDNPNPKSKKYIGRHPGTAFLELQFYPPGWVNSYSQTQYAVAMNIDSYNLKPLGPTGPILNNAACLNSIGVETVNFALLTLDGKSQAPGDPQNGDLAKSTVIPGETLLMNPGDRLIVSIQDTPAGLRTTVKDLTTGRTGWMTASIANGFANILFAPNATTCTSLPYAFHPMYATTSEHTSVPWAAHTYNVAFSDEIGHYNYCDVQDNSIFSGLGACLSSPVENEADPTTGAHNEADDLFCVDTASSVLFGSTSPLGGCLDSDVDFDGVPYHHAWPGSGKDPWGFSAVPTPVRFTSPRFRASGGEREDDLRSYSRVAFEADLAAIEDSSVCNNLTGAGCVNPPPGALFYPIYTTTHRDEECWWQIGGASIPGTTNKFGGSSATEFKTLFGQVAIDGTSSHPSSILIYENFHQILPNNPCR